MALVELVERVIESPRQRTVLLLIGVLGASLFYGDGMITPGDLGSVRGRGSERGLAEPLLDVIPISLFVLIVLFLAQRLGTGAVGVLFGPITAVWFAAIGLCGAVEVAAHPDILKSLSPTYWGDVPRGRPARRQPLGGVQIFPDALLAISGQAGTQDRHMFGGEVKRHWPRPARRVLVSHEEVRSPCGQAPGGVYAPPGSFLNERPAG